jgi:hypothetical protein
VKYAVNVVKEKKTIKKISYMHLAHSLDRKRAKNFVKSAEQW